MVALRSAEEVLDEAVTQPQFQDLRSRLFELGAALFQSIGMQLSLDLYGGYSKGRAATLDTVDAPLNDRVWLKTRFAEIRALPSEAARLKEISAIIEWKNPGPGGFYDDVGSLTQQPHLVRRADAEAAWVQARDDGPLAWASYVMSGRRAPVAHALHGFGSGSAIPGEGGLFRRRGKPGAGHPASGRRQVRGPSVYEETPAGAGRSNSTFRWKPRATAN